MSTVLSSFLCSIIVPFFWFMIPLMMGFRVVLYFQKVCPHFGGGSRELKALLAPMGNLGLNKIFC
jgi:hypothetical protein